ncbi:hypothetical protein Tco_1327237 [Tanacetum coccineum]
MSYVPESYPEEDPEEDDDEDPEEDPANYPANGGDDGDDEDESSDDDEDDDLNIKEDEEEEHPTPADFIAVALPTIPSPPLPPILSPLTVSSPPPANPTYPLGYKASMIWYEVGESSSTAAARSTGGFRANYGFLATMDREIKRDLERDVGYGIIDIWDEMLVDMPGAPATDDTELEAWGRSMDTSDLARSEVMSLRTTVLGQQAVITKLQERTQENRRDYRDVGKRTAETAHYT